jgi:hypothetical protein
MRPSLATFVVATALGAHASVADQPVPSLAGDWTGSYICMQGETALRLTITPKIGSGVAALFHFGRLPSNPNVPDGCFLMTGTFDPLTGRLTLIPTRWLLHPYSFVTVGLDGALDSSGSQIGGTVAGPGCTTFELSRRAFGRVDHGPCGAEPTPVATR